MSGMLRKNLPDGSEMRAPRAGSAERMCDVNQELRFFALDLASHRSPAPEEITRRLRAALCEGREIVAVEEQRSTEAGKVVESSRPIEVRKEPVLRGRAL